MGDSITTEVTLQIMITGKTDSGGIILQFFIVNYSCKISLFCSAHQLQWLRKNFLTLYAIRTGAQLATCITMGLPLLSPYLHYVTAVITLHYAI